ncbi:NAD-dependent protein deacetylase [Tessaracoccus oleiagri]|uniref:protein acetyllysine N-acetyltransferase n=1 Tax=Tessaracoccus oleiagri TaxID=686624 RepID=A0A1G9I4B9_9ACTN|nr:NAD-dependent protein deacetylase [Tessaracoccus oleiagri]SDL20090.1 NAD-dependent protein deacetylase, SIR2 family [Tessaracoccus oleiagri]
MTAPKTADVGGWFRTAADGVALPAAPGWGPGTGGFGRISGDEELRQALDLLHHRPTLVLTGAGMSTGSGLPDYRGPDARPRSPMLYQEFVGSDLSRRRYWARSTVGWRWFRQARPNAAHTSLAALEARLPSVGVVTQNVDGLHQRAGSPEVVDLHGRLDRVVCLGCEGVVDRDALQQHFLALNPSFAARMAALEEEAISAPDGDAEVDRTQDFRYPPCEACGGILKPDVVFFGENTRPEVTSSAFELLEQASTLLVLGSSLTVMSGLRFCRRAVRDGKPVVIVNDGATRGDDLAEVRVHGRLEDVLGAWVQMLGS